MFNLVTIFVRAFPGIKRDLMMAHMNDTPDDFVKKSLMLSSLSALVSTLLLFLIFNQQNVSLLSLPLFFLGVFVLSFFFMMNVPRVRIRRRERDINKEVLFAGRYILVKLESGTPLFNTLIDASNSYGVSGKYFKEIVDDINIGTPIEEALDKARKYNPSHNFRLILWQIITSLKTGAEITESLKTTLNRITQEEIIEIKEYGRKLNSLVMFYMIIACVIPSLGMTMLVILSSFMVLDIGIVHLFSLLFFLAFVQFLFISIIKSSRPMVNL